MSQDNIQHGIDDNPSGDAGKGAALGGLGGAAVGAVAGSVVGPLGTLIGAAVGAVSGAIASGAAVAAVDAIDNDDTVSGIGSGQTTTGDDYGTGGTTTGYGTTGYATDAAGHNVVTGEEAHSDAGKEGLAGGALMGGAVGALVGGPVGAVVGGTVGSLAGGVAGDASEAAVEGDTNYGTAGTGYGSTTADLTAGNNVPGVQTGGVTTAGADTRGLAEKTADVLTGDRTDDKTGGVVTGGNYGATTDKEVMRVPVVEEELQVGKEVRQSGEVEVRKHIVEEQVQVPVTLQREEVVVTRHAVDRPVSGNEMSEALEEGEIIRVPVREEVPVVSKTAHVVEEVEIAKTKVAQQQVVSDTVRREEIDIDGDVTGTTDATRNV